MRYNLYIYTARFIGLAGAGTALAFIWSNPIVQGSDTPTAKASCCPDGAFCPDGACCAAAKQTAVK